MNIAISVPVIESEAGWGQKVDDYMICSSEEIAKNFVTEFNYKNNKDKVPVIYWYAESDFRPTTLTEKQYEFLLSEDLEENEMGYIKLGGRAWLSELKRII